MKQIQGKLVLAQMIEIKAVALDFCILERVIDQSLRL